MRRLVSVELNVATGGDRCAGDVRRTVEADLDGLLVGINGVEARIAGFERHVADVGLNATAHVDVAAGLQVNVVTGGGNRRVLVDGYVAASRHSDFAYCRHSAQSDAVLVVELNRIPRLAWK